MKKIENETVCLDKDGNKVTSCQHEPTNEYAKDTDVALSSIYNHQLSIITEVGLGDPSSTNRTIVKGRKLQICQSIDKMPWEENDE